MFTQKKITFDSLIRGIISVIIIIAVLFLLICIKTKLIYAFVNVSCLLINVEYKFIIVD